MISEKYDEVKDCVSVTSKVYNHRAFNYIVGHFKHQPEEINPYMILRFDVKGINDLVTFRVGQSRKEHWIIVACNDGYIRVFSIKNLLLQRVIKGLGGVPLCIDVAETNGNVSQSVDREAHRDLMAVGYSDDSFIVYSILQGFKPLYKGTEHRSFVSQIKFDNNFMKKQMEDLAK